MTTAAQRPSLPHIAAYTENLYHCASCNYCVDAVWDEWGIDHVCATLLHHSPAHGYSGKGYIAAARAWFEGAVLDPMMLADRAFTCTTCGNCEEVCPIGMRPAQIAMALRAELADRGAAPEFALARRAALVAAQADHDAWAAGLDDDPTAPLGLFAGAAPDGGAEARAAFHLLRAAGRVRPITGAPGASGALAALGFPREAAAQRAALAQSLAERGVRHLAVADAECLADLARDPGFAEAVRVDSPLTLVAEAVAEGRLVLTPRADNPPPAAVGYLDPCHMTKKTHGLAGRDHATAARALLRQLGIAVREPAAAPRFQICCGGAGAMPEAQPQAARRMAETRLAEFAGAAAVVVSASPLCAAHLAGSETGGVAARGLCGFLLDHFAPASGDAP